MKLTIDINGDTKEDILEKLDYIGDLIHNDMISEEREDLTFVFDEFV